MDWTSIFLESGEEELFTVHDDDSPSTQVNARKTRLTRLVSAVYKHHHIQEQEQEQEQNFKALVRSTSSTSSSSEEEVERRGGYTLRALYCFSINYILGVGVCGIPYAFYKSGYLLGSFLVILITFISYMTVMWVAEAGARAELLLKRQQQSAIELNRDSNDVNRIGGTTHTLHRPDQQETSPLLLITSSSGLPCMDTDALTISTNTSTTPTPCKNLEVTDLVKLFLGPVHYYTYKISLLALMYIGLLAYTQVFCATLYALMYSSSSSNSGNYYLPLLIFCSIVVPLSCMDIEEQITMQAVLSIIRFVVIFAMIITSALGLIFRNTNGTNATSASTIPLIDTSGFGVAFSTALFSQLFQHSVPGLLRPLSHRPASTKQKIRTVFGACLFTTCSLYLLLGVTASSYFQKDTNPSVNLNFVPSYGSEYTQQTILHRVTWVTVTRVLRKWMNYIILLFPALDTLSVFPLVAITLGNNLLAVNHGQLAHYLTTVHPNSGLWMLLSFTKLFFIRSASQENGHCGNVADSIPRAPSVVSSLPSPPKHQQIRKRQANRIATLAFRLIASVPPLLGSMIAADLSFSLQVAGVAGLYVAFIAPALLHKKSFCCIETYTKTIYSGWYSKPYFASLVLIFAAFSMLVVCLQIRNYIYNNFGRTDNEDTKFPKNK